MSRLPLLFISLVCLTSAAEPELSKWIQTGLTETGDDQKLRLVCPNGYYASACYCENPMNCDGVILNTAIAMCTVQNSYGGGVTSRLLMKCNRFQKEMSVRRVRQVGGLPVHCADHEVMEFCTLLNPHSHDASYTLTHSMDPVSGRRSCAPAFIPSEATKKYLSTLNMFATCTTTVTLHKAAKAKAVAEAKARRTTLKPVEISMTTPKVTTLKPVEVTMTTPKTTTLKPVEGNTETTTLKLVDVTTNTPMPIEVTTHDFPIRTTSDDAVTTTEDDFSTMTTPMYVGVTTHAVPIRTPSDNNNDNVSPTGNGASTTLSPDERLQKILEDFGGQIG